MRKKYNTNAIMNKVKKNRPHVVNNALAKAKEKEEAGKTLLQGHKLMTAAAKKEAQVAKQKLKDIEDKKQKATEKAVRTRKKNKRASKQAKK